MSTLRLVLGDQLSASIATLSDIDKEADRVLMVEVGEEATYVRHHQQKLVLVLSAMRHFAAALKNDGVQVDYVRMDDKANTGSFSGEVNRALQRCHYDQLVVTEPGEWRVREMMQTWQEDFDIPVEIRNDDRFICSLAEFAQWAKNRKSLRLEYFYRAMRRKTGWLMAGDKPVGGKWNYDQQNRKSLPRGMTCPSRLRFETDEITREVMQLVKTHFGHHFGDLESFGWATRRVDAQRALEHFIAECLPGFGDYQDAMKNGEDFLFRPLSPPT